MRISVDDLNCWINNEPSPEDVGDDVEVVEDTNEDDENVDPKIKHEDVVKYLEICNKWAQQNNIELSKVMVLRELQEEAVKLKISAPMKQTLLNQFFK